MKGLWEAFLESFNATETTLKVPNSAPIFDVMMLGATS